MDKQCIIRDYDGNPTEITIHDFEEVKSIRLEIITGDDVLSVTRTDDSVEYYDSSDCRLRSFLDDAENIPLSRLDESKELFAWRDEKYGNEGGLK